MIAKRNPILKKRTDLDNLLQRVRIHFNHCMRLFAVLKKEIHVFIVGLKGEQRKQRDAHKRVKRIPSPFHTRYTKGSKRKEHVHKGVVMRTKSLP